MDYDITTETAPEQTVATTSVTTSLAGVGQSMERGFGRIMRALAEAGVQPTGMPFAIYPDVIDEDTAGRIDLCIPTTAEFSGDDDVRARTLEAVPAVSLIHRGRYGDLAPAYHALTTWMQAHGAAPADAPREAYLNDPRDVGEAETLTKITWPITEA